MNQASNTDQDLPLTRSAVLDSVTETQLLELEQQFEEQDRMGWKRRTEAYGWSDEESEAVWRWFGIQPKGER